MININLMDACQTCPHLEATSNYLYDITTMAKSEPCHEITCEHIDPSTLHTHDDRELSICLQVL